MLRASATQALRQCKKHRHPLLDNKSIKTSSCTRRGFFQPSTAAAAAVNPTLRLANQVRCLTTSNTNLLITQHHSSLLRRDGALVESQRLLLSPCLDSNGSSFSSSSFTFHQRAFSTKAAQKSDIAPSISSSSTVTSLDNNTDEEKKATALAPKNGGKTPKVDPLAESTKSPKSSPSNPPTSNTAITQIEKKGEPSTIKKSSDALRWALHSLFTILAKTPSTLWFYLTHPKDLRLKLAEIKQAAINEAHHYWMGSKLLAADVRTARHILGRTLRGSTLSRRERKQLLRTVTDVFRLVPMSIFVLVPFMEFALPFAIKLFPNMLPSTFRDSLKEEEKMKRELQMRISMAGFFQDTLTELAKEQKKVATEVRKHDVANDDKDFDQESIEIIAKEASASSFLEFLKKARTGEPIPPDVIIKFAKCIDDTLTLDNMGRMQLINLCKYMGIPPYGSNDLLRFYLRHRIRALKDDDQRITWEGIESLTKMELREACRERGMRSTGLSKEAYKTALQQWLDLSVQKNVPTSLLIMSRTFYLHDEMVSGENEAGIDDGSKGVTGLADAMSGIDKEVLNEIVLGMASSEEKSKNADVMKIHLEVLEHQNELIKEEQQERDAAAKEKEEKEKKEKAKEAAEAISDYESSIKNDEAMDDDKTTFSKDDADIQMKDKTDASTTGSDSLASPTVSQGNEKDEETTTTDEENEQTKFDLSTEEIDAISQLASPDPVQKEREELQRIKDTMKGDVVDEPSFASSDEQQPVDDGDEQLRVNTEEAQEEAVKSMKELEDDIEKEAKEANVISMDGDIIEGEKEEGSSADDNAGSEEVFGDVKLQKAIDRLKSRVESMVGKIETQLTETETKIGNKFHLLDTDNDGILTMEEMAQVLQTVLKTRLTLEEAMAIAADMDQNKDGVFSIAELAQWCETNTIVKLAEDGREKDLDEMITERVQERRKLKEEDDEWTGM